MSAQRSPLRVPSSHALRDPRQHPYRRPLHQDEDAESPDDQNPDIEGAVHFLQEVGEFRVDDDDDDDDDDDTEGYNGHEEREEEELELSMLSLIIVQLVVLLAMSVEPLTFGFVLRF